MERKLSEQQIVRREKIKKLLSMGISPYTKTKSFDTNSKKLTEDYSQMSKENLESLHIVHSIAGRIIARRGPFVVIEDKCGQVQIYVDKTNSPKIYELLDFLDIGDIVWVLGNVIKTKTGLVTLKAIEVQLLSKSLNPLPEKYHGLKDVEERYRHRYVDLIMNASSRNILRTRIKIVKSIKKYFDNLDYLEVETPILEPILGGAAAKPFKTFHNALHRDFYLRIATELPLKKLIIGGMDRVYEMGRIFRNEGIDTTHNPEFTSIEFYEAYSDLSGMMIRTEEVFRAVAKELGVKEVVYDDKTIIIDKPFKRITMAQAIFEQTKIDFTNKKMTLEKAKELAKEHHIKIEPYYKVGHIMNSFFEEYVEKTLIQPTFIYSFPIEISPLAAIDQDDKRFTHRAELFINCREYANMFTELIDPIDQLERLESQSDERDSGNEEANEIDWNFIDALEYGMPPTGGCGIGIDRLVMLFTNSQSIREVIIFPHMKKKDQAN